MKELIFGMTGLDGYYLRSVCHRNGIGPIGISRSGSGVPFMNVGKPISEKELAVVRLPSKRVSC
jgi:GDP-D-mannose dehydratase